jgi:hypothetical protein
MRVRAARHHGGAARPDPRRRCRAVRGVATAGRPSPGRFDDIPCPAFFAAVVGPGWGWWLLRVGVPLPGSETDCPAVPLRGQRPHHHAYPGPHRPLRSSALDEPPSGLSWSARGVGSRRRLAGQCAVEPAGESTTAFSVVCGDGETRPGSRPAAAAGRRANPVVGFGPHQLAGFRIGVMSDRRSDELIAALDGVVRRCCMRRRCAWFRPAGPPVDRQHQSGHRCERYARVDRR